MWRRKFTPQQLILNANVFICASFRYGRNDQKRIVWGEVIKLLKFWVSLIMDIFDISICLIARSRNIACVCNFVHVEGVNSHSFCFFYKRFNVISKKSRTVWMKISFSIKVFDKNEIMGHCRKRKSVMYVFWFAVLGKQCYW